MVDLATAQVAQPEILGPVKSRFINGVVAAPWRGVIKMTAISESSKIANIDVFLAYRRGEGEGDSFADDLYERLSRNPVISYSDGKEYQLSVFYDRRTPGSDDWQRFWRVRLRTARALILICTPGAAQPRSALPDVLYEEINWWCKNRKNGPIVIDANGGGELAIPGPVRKLLAKSRKTRLAFFGQFGSSY
ncbi:MAG: hypothetical protein R3C49_19605 [Planctomycetaceae bacterium]